MNEVYVQEQAVNYRWYTSEQVTIVLIIILQMM